MRNVTYWLTRDSNCMGHLSTTIDVWYIKPIRFKLTMDHGYVWLPSSLGERKRDLGFYGAFSVDQCRAWFSTIPDNDIECVRAETQVES